MQSWCRHTSSWKLELTHKWNWGTVINRMVKVRKELHWWHASQNKKSWPLTTLQKVVRQRKKVQNSLAKPSVQAIKGLFFLVTNKELFVCSVRPSLCTPLGGPCSYMIFSCDIIKDERSLKRTPAWLSAFWQTKRSLKITQDLMKS